jgi:hypothetical protein
LVPAAIGAVVVLLLAGFVLTRGGGSKSAGAGEIFLEPAAQQGTAPFTPTVAAAPPVPVPAPDPAAPDTTVQAGTTSIQSTSGSRPGLYGGTRKNSSCDKAALVGFLQQNPDKANAFASVAGIAAADIPAYIANLTPVILRSDTRVTNNGFANGKATPRRAVLQAGTAVLADELGVPRVRCACGNPLAAPKAVQATPTYTGKAWPGFAPANVEVVAPAPQPVTALVLEDPVANVSFARPVGSDGASDGPPGPPIVNATPVASTTTSTARAATSTTAPTTGSTADIPKPNADATKEGTVTASSTFSSATPASLAVDGDKTTSWFGKGASTFTWTGTKDDLVTEVRITGSPQANAGFASVTVEVLDEFGDSDFTETAQLSGTPDPEVVVRPGVKGRTVKLTFTGPEDPSHAGFAELKIGVTR